MRLRFDRLRSAAAVVVSALVVLVGSLAPAASASAPAPQSFPDTLVAGGNALAPQSLSQTLVAGGALAPQALTEPLAVGDALTPQSLAEPLAVGGSGFPQQRPFKETFGSAAQPSLQWGTAITVEQSTGDVLVADYVAKTLSRFHADGTSAPFAALGTNVIDGKEDNGKPCAEEPASCDQTPQNGIEAGYGGGTQIAIDESGGVAKGDIYLTQQSSELVDIFAADGRYLGQITQDGLRDFSFFNTPDGIAVDKAGAVYVSHGTSISKYLPSANPVVNTDLAEDLEVGRSLWGLSLGSGPNAASIFSTTEGQGIEHALQIDKATGQVEFEFGANREKQRVIAVDPTTHNILVGAAEYEAPGESQPVKVGRFLPGSEQVWGLAINSSSEVFVTEHAYPTTISVYGLPAVVPAVATEPAVEVIGTRALLAGTVNPDGLAVSKCIFEYGETAKYGSEAPCEGPIPTDSSPHPVHATISGLKPNGHAYHFRLVAFNANGREETADQTLTTANTFLTEPASAVGLSSATLKGVVRPEGEPYSECFFEYGLTTSASFEGKAQCSPGAAAIPTDFSPHEVRAAITGLQSDVSYRYRLVVANSLGTLKGEEVTFETFGAPRIEEVQASDASQDSVTLEARIDPSGLGTSYHFEWGSSTAYGNSVPVEFEPFLGSGTEPILVKTKLSGLSVASSYHYRVVASNGSGTTQSPDHVAETLDACGLPDGRCFELVSRREAGPVAIPGESNAAIEMHYQAATGGPGGLAYPVEGGYPEASKGAEVLYRALRGPEGWVSSQLSPPILALNERNDAVSVSSATHWLSDDLSCGVTESTQPLTSDPSMRLVREVGGSNLYRINPDGSYTGITNIAPNNVTTASEVSIPAYQVAGVSRDCGVVLFATRLRYPGVPAEAGPGGLRLYEWDHGALRNAGIVPGPSGEVSVPATAGGSAAVVEADTQNSVSEDGSRIFFTAERQASPNPAEIGARGVFVRENGSVTHDVSLSQTSTPDTGAEYQWATADGSRVFFTANAGLTAESSSAGTDLYEYNLETKKLTDRSVTQAEGGAQVIGFLGASADGSQVYFASPNQLVPGSGNSLAQNVRDESYSIYGERAGEISFVGTFNSTDRKYVLISDAAGEWTSQVSPDGRYLLFQSSASVTGYHSDGLIEAYLYDAQDGSQGTTCVSCRQDGLPSAGDRYGSPHYPVLSRNTEIQNELHPPRFLTMRNGVPTVFFSSPDPLAPGAVPGQNNVYEWSHDQVFRLVSALEGTQEHPSPGRFAAFAGASEDGSDVYLITPETLTWEDGDQRLSAYDARIGGGFPQPAAPPAPCDATAEGSCQGSGPAGAVVPGAATETFSGPGSPEQQPSKQQKQTKSTKKKAKRKARKKVRSRRNRGKKRLRRQHPRKKRTGKQSGGRSKKKSPRHANSNRRAGK